MKSEQVARLALLVIVVVTWGCSPPTDSHPDGDADSDADSDGDVDLDADPDPDVDEEPQSCDDPSDCDDGFECTQDVCGAGAVCRHIPLDELCPDEQRCIEGQGCREFQCENPGECADENFCNGDERCVMGRCYPAESPRDCDDGSDCTADSCNIATDQCVHDPLPGCIPDADIDGDMVPDPFDPEVHYSGSFRIAPSPSSGCGAATFSVRSLRFSSTPDRLTIQGIPDSWINLTQEPRPADGSFSTTYTQDRCGNYALSGTFSNSDTFTGRWTATFFGGCSSCDSQDYEVAGVRSP